MIRSKIFAVTAVVLFVIGIAMIDCAVAGEKVKAYATSITTKFHKLEVGDEEGHMVAVYESKAVWFNKITGVKSTALGTGIMDINEI